MNVRTVPLEEHHLENMLKWLQDADLRDHLGTVYPPARAQHLEWYRALTADRTRLALAIEADGVHVGVVGLSGIDLVYRCAELWIYLGEGQARGQGAAREAFRQACAYGFGTLGLNRIFVQVFSFNERARRFFEACGMKPEGVLREAVFKRGRFHDKHVLGLLAREFQDG
ncbi:MAG TPA: GNAT family protein [Anaeromyxobacter sp.]|nr:GNAT family protein [Anaeromyxobacter sp.]